MTPWLDINTPFPSVTQSLSAPESVAGLLAAGADLSVDRLLNAYRLGIFPWYSDNQPILWWSPDPRMVLFVDEFKLSKSLKKTLSQFEHNPNAQFKFDHAFEAVIKACAASREAKGGTWINKEMIQAYTNLHHQGYAHSSEVWLNGELVGGCYGVCIGQMFYGESMFSKLSNTSKMALAKLVFFLKSKQVEMIDCQQQTQHLASLGAVSISRTQFIDWITKATQQPTVTGWKS